MIYSTELDREIVNFLTCIAPATATAAEVYANCPSLSFADKPVMRTAAHLKRVIDKGLIIRNKDKSYTVASQFPGRPYRLPAYCKLRVR